MERMIKNSDPWALHIETLWWLHIVEKLSGKVLMVGEFNNNTLNYLSQYCQIDLIQNISNKTSANKNINHISYADSLNSDYRAIIIDAVKDSDYNDSNKYDMIINNSHNSTYICVLEKNEFALANGVKNVLLKLLNVFYDFRVSQFKRNNIKFKITKLPTIYYENEPYESFKEGSYSSNKNIFQIREKLRCALLRSRLSRLFVPTNMLLLSNKGEEDFLHHRLLLQIADIQLFDHSQYKLANIYYKRGKLIFSYNNYKDISRSIIAIVPFEEKSYKQRVNEEEVISELKSYSSLNHYLPNNYFSFDFYGYKVFSMYGCNGVTVDSDSKHLPVMTKNISAVLYTLSKVTNKYVNDRGYPNQWLDILQSRVHGFDNEIRILKTFFSGNTCNVAVCMHGDAKIENFVLDNKNNVVGIIDWEQGNMQGYPLIDIYYLIVYNYQLKHGDGFYDAYFALNKGLIDGYENNILKEYYAMMKLSDEDIVYLMILFFVHHYSCRFHADPKYKASFTSYRESLLMAVELAEGLM